MNGVRSESFRQRYVMLFLVASIVGMMLLYVLIKGNPSLVEWICSVDVFLNFILGVFTSIVATLLVFWLTVRYIQPEEVFERKNLLNEAVDRVICATLREMPKNIYHGSQSTNAAFNQHVKESFIKSERYIFSGNSGKYVPVRAFKYKCGQVRKTSTTLMINNPFNSDIVLAMDAHKNAIFEKKGQSIKGGSQRIYVEHFAVMLYGFFKCYSLFGKVDIILSRHAILNRFELSDQDLFLEVFLGSDIRTNEYPTIYRYDSGSFIYSYFKGNFAGYNYQGLHGRERKYEAEFGALSVKIRDGVQPSIEGFSLVALNTPVTDEKVVDFVCQVICEISGIVLDQSKVSALFDSLLGHV